MDRAIEQQEKEKVRAARADFFGVQKRRLSNSHHSQTNKTSTSTRASQPENMSSSKRFKFPGMTSSKAADNASGSSLIINFYDSAVKAKDAHARTLEEILDWPDSQLERCHNYIQMLFPVPEGSMFNWEAPIIDRQVMETFRARQELQDQLRKAFVRMLHFYGFAYASELEQEKEDQATEQTEGNSATAGASTEGQAKDGHVQGSSAEESKKGSSAIIDSAQDTATGKTNDTVTTDQKSAPESTTPTDYTIVRGPHWHRNSRNWAVRFDHNHLRITRILRCLRVLGLQEECDAFYVALQDVFSDSNIHINERSMIYWKRAATRPLYIAPDDDRIEWLREWEKEQEALKDRKDEA